MSHPYTDPYGYPLTAAEALKQMVAREQMRTGPTRGGLLRPANDVATETKTEEDKK